MIQITFLQPDGSRKTCAARPGTSLMETAVQGAVAGIIAECNGSAACATCHVVLPPDLFDRLAPPGDHEADMLDFAQSPRQPCSRLSCQITVTPEMDGSVIAVPAP